MSELNWIIGHPVGVQTLGEENPHAAFLSVVVNKETMVVPSHG